MVSDLHLLFVGVCSMFPDRGYLGPDADIFADDHPEMKFHRILYHDHVFWYFYSEEDRSTFDRYCEHIADSKWAANVMGA